MSTHHSAGSMPRVSPTGQSTSWLVTEQGRKGEFTVTIAKLQSNLEQQYRYLFLMWCLQWFSLRLSILH